MGFNLTNPIVAYDLTQGGVYSGITFDAMAATGTLTAVRFEVSDLNSDTYGGICTVCTDYPGSNLAFTNSWAPYSVSFASMTQMGYGVPVEAHLNAANAFTISWVVNSAGATFNFSVDNISLY
jgi:hypothetical protein